jgi:hypothetical protein
MSSTFCVRKRRTGNWIGDMLWNCVLEHVEEGKMKTKIEVTERRSRRIKQLLDDLKVGMIL